MIFAFSCRGDCCPCISPLPVSVFGTSRALDWIRLGCAVPPTCSWHSLQHHCIPNLMLVTSVVLGRCAWAVSYGFSSLAASWFQAKNSNVRAISQCACLLSVDTLIDKYTRGCKTLQESPPVWMMRKLRVWTASILQHRHEKLFSLVPFILQSDSKMFWCSVHASLSWLKLPGCNLFAHSQQGAIISLSWMYVMIASSHLQSFTWSLLFCLFNFPLPPF